jgi:hypothetical protein
MSNDIEWVNWTNYGFDKEGTKYNKFHDRNKNQVIHNCGKPKEIKDEQKES